MITNREFVVCVLLTAMLLISMAYVLTVSALQEEGTEQELNFGPETFEELKNSPDVLAAYGKMPFFENAEQRREWFDLLTDIGVKVRDDPQYNISDYMYPEGSIVEYGIDVNGYLIVTVNKDIEKPLMDYIYGMFDQQAQTKGIKEVPLVFERGEVPIEGLMPAEADLNETENSTNQQTKSGSETSKEKPNNVPGFSFMYGLFGLYLVCRIRY